MHLKMSSAKWRPFCLGPNVLRHVEQKGNGVEPSCKTVMVILMMRYETDFLSSRRQPTID